jgi:hypothetical protein
MKLILKYIAFLGLALVALAACNTDKLDYPDAYKVADGIPVVKSIRYANTDTYITQAYMNETVCLLGDNLRSVTQLWFNDQKATLNTSYITDNTLLVSVPKNYPQKRTDKIYLITKNEADTVKYDFVVLPPLPNVASMSNEWAAVGEEVTIYGDYFIDDTSSPVVISFPGADVPHADMTFDGSSSVTFKVPAGALPGYVSVKTMSGTSRSKFMYKDSRNILFDWDGSRGGHAIGQGWRNGSKVHRTPGSDPFPAIDGNYICFQGKEVGPGASDVWDEDNLSFNYWPTPGDPLKGELSLRPEFARLIEDYGIGGLQIKFEALVNTPWTNVGLQLVFTSNADVTMAAATNAYFGNVSIARGIWEPWVSAGGSFDTAGKWITVSIPLSDFNKKPNGTASESTLKADSLTGLSFFLWYGTSSGTKCTPTIAIDNIRVVPIG